MRRTRIDQEQIVDFRTLSHAAVTASFGKRNRPDVRRFFESFDKNIEELRKDLISGRAPYNDFRTFTIYDPKKRDITAVSFEDRIIHHAIMRFAGSPMDTSLIHHTYACRIGKGPLQAVYQAQSNVRRFPWYVKIDIDKYFETLDHQILLELIKRKFKGDFFLDMVRRIVNGYATKTGKGLPIGSLTSQHFANFYLNDVDRFILEQTPAKAYIRYMDDMVWWCDESKTAQKILNHVRQFIQERRLLKVKDNAQLHRSHFGLTYCGFRIFPDTLRLTRRKKQRYVKRRMYWEQRYESEQINSGQLQRAYDSVKGVIAHASAEAWIRQQNRRFPCLEA